MLFLNLFLGLFLRVEHFWKTNKTCYLLMYLSDCITESTIHCWMGCIVAWVIILHIEGSFRIPRWHSQFSVSYLCHMMVIQKLFWRFFIKYFICNMNITASLHFSIETKISLFQYCCPINLHWAPISLTWTRTLSVTYLAWSPLLLQLPYYFICSGNLPLIGTLLIL